MTYVITDFAVGDKVVIVAKDNGADYRWVSNSHIKDFIDIVCEVDEVDFNNPSVRIKRQDGGLAWFAPSEIAINFRHYQNCHSVSDKRTPDMSVESAINFLVERGYEVIIKKANR